MPKKQTKIDTTLIMEKLKNKHPDQEQPQNENIISLFQFQQKFYLKLMLEETRQKRLSMTQNIDCLRNRIKSSQKRKQIQENLNKFKREVDSSRSVLVFKDDQSLKNSFGSGNFHEDGSLMQSPTMRDLNIRNESGEKDQIESPRFRQQQLTDALIKNGIEQNLGNQSKVLPEGNQELNKEEQQKEQRKSNIGQQNESQKQKSVIQSNSGVHFQQGKMSMERNEEEQKQDEVSKQFQSLSNKFDGDGQKSQDKGKDAKDQGEYVEGKSFNKEKNEQNELNFNYNDSKYEGSSSNGSSAIFFTSQFREFINRDKDPQQVKQQKQEPQNVPPQSQIVPISQTQQSSKLPLQMNMSERQIGQSFLKISQEQISEMNESGNKKLSHVQSGRSLAFSNNDESINMSLNRAIGGKDQSQSSYGRSQHNLYVNGYGNGYGQESGNFDLSGGSGMDLVYKKLGQQLVIQIDHFNIKKDNENNSIKVEQSMNELENNNSPKTNQQSSKNIEIFAQRLMIVILRNNNNFKRQVFDELLVLEQIRLLEIKNEIKCNNFMKEKQFKILCESFNMLKDNYQKKEEDADSLLSLKNDKIKRAVFEVFKMIRYDSKIKNQADLYYLSKIFAAMRLAISKQKKVMDNMALKQYFKSLKKNHWRLFLEGVQAMRKERLNEELAEEHWRYLALKKCFDGWLNECDKAPQYVSLTMTSKDFYKQKQGKWMGVRTLDFKQIKR